MTDDSRSHPDLSDSGAGMTVLVVGATGSIGRYVVAEALRHGHRPRALVRPAKARGAVPEGAQVVVGDLTAPETLTAAVDGINAVVFTHGSHGSAEDAERVDYGAVRNVLSVLRSDRSGPVRIALMTTIGVTRHTPGHDWKQRGERLVRASGLPYTIVRPGWFDYNAPDELRLQMLQGDGRWAGDPSDGVVSRAQIAQVLVGSLTLPAAECTTLELVAERGPAVSNLELLFTGLRRDVPGHLDAVLDIENMPADEEPAGVLADLARLRNRNAR